MFLLRKFSKQEGCYNLKKIKCHAKSNCKHKIITFTITKLHFISVYNNYYQKVMQRKQIAVK